MCMGRWKTEAFISYVKLARVKRCKITEELTKRVKEKRNI